MSFGSSGSGEGMSVGTLTATYKLIQDRQNQTTVGQIVQEGNQIRNVFGNVQMRLDTSQYVPAVNQMIAANTSYKQAAAQAQQALAQLRQEQVLGAQAVTAQKTALAAAAQTFADTRVVQQQTAITTRDYNAALKDLALNTAQSRDMTATANQATAQYRQELTQIRLAMAQAAQAAQQQGQAHQGLMQWIQQSTIAGAAFRAGEDLLQASLRAVEGAIKDSVGAFINWQQEVQRVGANSQLTNDELKQMDTSIRNMVATAPASMSQLAQGFRLASDEGFNIAQSQQLANVAMMAAVGTGANETDVMNVLAVAMHIFHLNTTEANQTMDVLIQSAKLGRLTLEEFVTGTQRAQSVAANYGLSLTDTTAALSAFTRNGYTASQASTQFVGLLTHIADPAKEVRGELVSLSQATGVNLVADFTHAGLAAKGLTGVLADVQTVIEKTGDESIISRLVPALRGAQGGYVLLGNGAQDYANIQASLNQVLTGQATPTLDAYKNASQTAAFQIGVLKNELHLFGLEIGERLVPYLQMAVQWMQSLLQSLGVDFKIPGMETLHTETEAVAAGAGNAATAIGKMNFAAIEDKSKAIIDASANIDKLGNDADATAAKIRELTATGVSLKASMDGINESIAKAKDDFGSLINPAEAQLRAINAITPEEFNRHIQELNLQAQEIQLKLAAPDTTSYTQAIDQLKQKILDMGEPNTAALDTTIENLRTKLDDLGQADTGAVDARLEMLRDKMQALGKIATVELDKQITGLRTQLDSLGNTTNIDRQIEDIQAKMKAPDQSTAVQEAGMAGLTSQLAGGTINYAAFDAAYGALGRQKQAIVENNTVRKTALQQELADLETKRTLQKRIDEDAATAINQQIKNLELEKARREEANTIAKANVQDQIDAANKERDGIVKKHEADRAGIEAEIKADEKKRKGVIDTFNTEKKGYEDRIKQYEIDKSAATADYDAKMKSYQSQMDSLKLLDSQSSITRDIAAYPLKTQIDGWKQGLQDALDPLQRHKDGVQALIDKNNEDLGVQRSKKAEIDAQVQSAKELLKTLQNDPTDSGAGGKPPGPPVPKPGEPLGPPSGPGTQPGWGGAGGVGKSASPPWLTEMILDATAFKNAVTDVIADLGSLYGYLNDNYPTLLSAKQAWNDLVGAYNDGKKTIQVLGDVLRGDWDQAWKDINNDTSGNVGKVETIYDEFGNKIGVYQDTHGKILVDQHNDLGDKVERATMVSTKKWTDQYDEFGRKTGKVQQDYQASYLTDWGAFFDKFVGMGVIKWADIQQEWDRETSDMGKKFGTVFGKGGTIANFMSDLGTTTNDWFGEGGKVGQKFDEFGTYLNRHFGENGIFAGHMETFRLYVRNLFAPGGPLGTVISDFGSVAKYAFNNGIIDPINSAIDKFGQFINKISGGIKGLAGKLGVTIDIPDVKIPSIPFLAVGTENWQGGAAVVGEKGREIGIIDGMAHLFDRPQVVNLPPGSIVKSNSETEQLISNAGSTRNIGGTPSAFANSLAMGSTGNYGLGGVFSVIQGGASAVGNTFSNLAGEAASVARGIISGGFDAMVDGVMKAAGVPAFPGEMGGMGAGVVSTVAGVVKDGLKELWDSLVSNTPKAQYLGGGVYGGSGSALIPLLDLIRTSASNYNVPPEIVGAIILHESGGEIGKREIGGGLGRGLMQVDGGTWPQAYDPRMSGTSLDDAAYQIDVGSMILGKYFAAAGGDVEKALTGYSGTGFPSQHGGLDFYQELQKMGLISAAQSALAGLLPLGPVAGGNGNVVDQAAQWIGHVGSNGLTNDGEWSGWCERFVEFMNQFAGTGLSSGTFESAAVHMRNSMTSSDTNPPAGASVFWYGPNWGGTYGHVGVAVGDGDVISTTGLVGQHTPVRRSSGWIGAAGYQGWAPPGMKNGGIFGTPSIVTVGDIPGRVPEIVAPQPMMKQSVKDAILEMGAGGGGGGDVIFQAGAIVAAPGMDVNDLADAIAERVRRRMQGNGKNGI